MNENPYKHLRRDTRELLEHECWLSYPSMYKGYEVIEAYNPKGSRMYINIFVGIQEGRWVCGCRYELYNEGGGYSPSRKWGDFATRQDAILFMLGELRSRFANRNDSRFKPIITALNRAIFECSQMQLTLF